MDWKPEDQKVHFELIVAAEYVRDHDGLSEHTKDQYPFDASDPAFIVAAKKVAKHLLDTTPRMEGKVKHLPGEESTDV